MLSKKYISLYKQTETMKTFLLFIFIFVFFPFFGQNVDQLIIKKVNEYRKENLLQPLCYSEKAKIANKQI